MLGEDFVSELVHAGLRNDGLSRHGVERAVKKDLGWTIHVNRQDVPGGMAVRPYHMSVARLTGGFERTSVDVGLMCSVWMYDVREARYGARRTEVCAAIVYIDVEHPDVSHTRMVSGIRYGRRQNR